MSSTILPQHSTPKTARQTLSENTGLHRIDTEQKQAIPRRSTIAHKCAECEYSIQAQSEHYLVRSLFNEYESTLRHIHGGCINANLGIKKLSPLNNPP